MEWLTETLMQHSAMQAVIVLSVICALGLALGRLKVMGVSLGVTFVFFMGITLGHLGFSIDPHVLEYAEDFGLAMFVYALGVQVGPGFFSSLRKSGLQLTMLALLLVAVGTAVAIALPAVAGVSLSEAVGLLCGATTNTPALGAAQQALAQMGLPVSGAALACAVTYPLGVVGVIVALAVMNKTIASRTTAASDAADTHDDTFIAAYHVTNPGLFGKKISELSHLTHEKFVISRVWRQGKVTIPSGATVLEQNDRVLVITTPKSAEAMHLIFGEQESTDYNKADIDWNVLDSRLVSRRILVTKSDINGRQLSSLKLREHYGVNVTRILRSGMKLLATPELRLQMGDRITVVGEEASIKNVAALLGNAVRDLDEPNMISVFLGLTLGLLLGLIPIAIPGISAPVRLGLAGGPIIAGILMGTFGPRLHMVTYTTQSASLMMRSLGLSLYLACLGLDSGRDFFATVMRPEGLLWVGAGFVLTVVPVLIVGYFAVKGMKIDFGTVSGMLCGAMANPMALDYARDTLKSDRASVAYTTVYPLCMFVRVIVAQLIILLMV